MRRQILGLFLFISFLLVPVARAQQQTTPITPKTRIEGRVLELIEAGDGYKEIAAVDVEFYFENVDDMTRLDGKSGGNGKYKIEQTGKLPEGKWQVGFYATEGLMLVNLRAKIPADSGNIFDDLAPVTVETGWKAEPIPLKSLGNNSIDLLMMPAKQGRVYIMDREGIKVERAVQVAPAQKSPGQAAWDEAFAFINAKDWAQAIPLLKTAVTAEGAQAEWRFYYSYALLSNKQYAAAKQASIDALKVEPTNFGYVKLIYNCNQRLGLAKKAVAKDAFGHAKGIDPIKLIPDDLLSTAPGNRQKALEDWHLYVFLADEADDINAEIAAYQALLAVDEEDDQIWYDLGDAYRDLGKGVEAKRAYLKVVSLAGAAQKGKALYLLGTLAERDKNLNEAITFYDRAIKAYKNAGEAAERNLARTYHRLGNTLLNPDYQGTDGCLRAIEAYLGYLDLPHNEDNDEAVNGYIDQCRASLGQ